MSGQKNVSSISPQLSVGRRCEDESNAPSSRRSEAHNAPTVRNEKHERGAQKEAQTKERASERGENEREQRGHARRQHTGRERRHARERRGDTRRSYTERGGTPNEHNRSSRRWEGGNKLTRARALRELGDLTRPRDRARVVSILYLAVYNCYRRLVRTLLVVCVTRVRQHVCAMRRVRSVRVRRPSGAVRFVVCVGVRSVTRMRTIRRTFYSTSARRSPRVRARSPGPRR
jgi:hypothetical protein